MSKSLGAKIKALRQQKGFSLEKLGELTETSKSYIWELENRSSCNPTTDKLEKISQALGVTSDYLIDDSATLSSDILQKAFFRRFNQLDASDKKKIEQIIELWAKKE